MHLLLRCRIVHGFRAVDMLIENPSDEFGVIRFRRGLRRNRGELD